MLESKGITVYRIDDTTGQTDVSLNTRLQRAIAHNSDLHVSIHQNATGDGWTEATGIETYYNVLGSAKSQELAKQAANKMSEYMNEKNRGAKTANLFITREFTAVGIDANLYEGSFMSNKEDVEQMKTNTYAENYAKAVAESILNVYRNEISSEPFVVQVRKDLNETLTVRNKPHYTGEYVTELVPGECVTIVSVKDGWGELKSGLGYINLSSKYTEEITLK
jgi:N-acetylmuramoyl-L-alanine amidase